MTLTAFTTSLTVSNGTTYSVSLFEISIAPGAWFEFSLLPVIKNYDPNMYPEQRSLLAVSLSWPYPNLWLQAGYRKFNSIQFRRKARPDELPW